MAEKPNQGLPACLHSGDHPYGDFLHVLCQMLYPVFWPSAAAASPQAFKIKAVEHSDTYYEAFMSVLLDRIKVPDDGGSDAGGGDLDDHPSTAGAEEFALGGRVGSYASVGTPKKSIVKRAASVHQNHHDHHHQQHLSAVLEALAEQMQMQTRAQEATATAVRGGAQTSRC